MNEQKIAEIIAIMEASGDVEQTRKLRQLQDKLNAKLLNLAFCGHFSAGKSSLINTLCGHELLPSGPIPTSANVVTIRNGSASAKVAPIRKSDATAITIPLEELPAYCKDGAEIESIEIHYPIPFLGGAVQLLDTPGIDSTDSAHMLATESALHLADVVFYVMDYNHVLSEMNLAFAKRMKDRGKPLYLIVNQIDKHHSQELSFDEFRHGVESSFRNWQAEPDGIMYLSLKKPNHLENEWDKLIRIIELLIQQAESLLERSANSSLRQLISDHDQWMKTLHEPDKARYREEIALDENVEALILRDEAIVQEIVQLRSRPDQLYAEWKKEMTTILENANLMPASTRDLAQQYLVARKPGFKVGLFSRASQTEKEIERRLKVFYDDFRERVQVHLNWHLKDYVKQTIEKLGLKNIESTADLDSLDVSFPEAWLADQVNPGAVFANEYTLTYTQLISAEVKAMLRKKGMALLEQLLSAETEACRQSASQLEIDAEQLSLRLSAFRRLQQIEQDEQTHLESLLKLAGTIQNEFAILPNPKDFTGRTIVQTDEIMFDEKETEKDETNRRSSAVHELAELPSDWLIRQPDGRLKQTAGRLKQAAELLNEMPAMKSLVKSLQEKAERLQNNRFTIALFGAFSAGKSSFANALIGERILPVSPNPTTAAINKIAPPTAEWPHGSVRVKMKERAFLLSEIEFSLDVLGLRVSDTEQMLVEIAKLSPEQVVASGKPHYSFLKAVAQGWNEAEPNFGAELRVDLPQFSQYVAEESKSCFVDYIELHYANALTDQGVVFVDTPGADSIHARHTGVAFNYIKNADAILFVTYYNHAFSLADRQFLQQLGRVKDSFEMDKMFFIVNAADLASSQAELDQVVKHVEENLLQQGIRHSRIYPVSSKQAVDAKMTGDCSLFALSGIQHFEESFNRFTFEEMTQMAIHSAKGEISRAVDVLQEWIDGAREDAQERSKKLVQLESAVTGAKTVLETFAHVTMKDELVKEIQELLYYVKQRVSYRFGEFYQISFNPSTLREDGQDMRKLLRSAWMEFTQLLSYELSQEVLSTTLRVEQFIHRSIKKRLEQFTVELCGIFPTYLAEAYTPTDYSTPTIEEKTEEVSVEDKWLLSFFKNGRYFFEGEGKQRLRVELEPIVTQIIHRFVDRHLPILEAVYLMQEEADWTALLSRQKASIFEHYEGLHDALQMKIDEVELIAKQDQLRKLLRD